MATGGRRLLFTGRDVKDVGDISLSKDSLRRLQSTRKYLQRQLLQAETEWDFSKAEALRVKLQLLRDAGDQDKASKRLQEEEDFGMWLLGKGKESDHIRTPWFRTPLINTVTGAREYVETRMKARHDLMEKVASLRVSMAPSDIKEAYEFYKYVVKGEENGVLDEMEGWTDMVDHEEDRLRFGEKAAERLERYWQKGGTIMPEDDVKMLQTDFDAYCQWYYATNHPDRDRFRNKLELRSRLIETLNMHSHYPQIRRLLTEYQDNVLQYDDSLVYSVRALESLQNQEKLVLERLSKISETTEYGEVDEVIRAASQKVQEIRNAMAAVRQNIADRLEKGASPEAVKAELERRARRFKLPREVMQVLEGELAFEDALVLQEQRVVIWRKLLTAVGAMIPVLPNVSRMPEAQAYQFRLLVQELLDAFSQLEEME